MSKITRIIALIGLFIFYIAIVIFIRSKFTDTSSFLSTIQAIYENVGFPLIFFGGMLEGIFLVGLFVPGSAVLLMGAALSRIGVVNFPTVFILGTSGLVLGYNINYFLGKYGWYHLLAFLGLEKGIEAGKEKLRKHGLGTILWGYFIPGSASLLSTACGILNINFKRFVMLSILAQSFWSLLWGTIAYFFGLQIVEFIVKYFIFFIIAIAVWWGIKKMLFKK